MKKKLFQIGFILLLAILVSTGINFSLKKNQSNFSLGVANIEALATGEIDVNIDFSFKEDIIFSKSLIVADVITFLSNLSFSSDTSVNSCSILFISSSSEGISSVINRIFSNIISL